MRVALITGASSGIGRAAAIRLAQDGFKLSITGRKAEELQQTADACVTKGINKEQILITPGDLSNAPFAKKLVDDTISKFGSLYTLVNSAGILMAGPVLDTELDVLDKQMDINVRSVVQLTRFALPHIIKEKGTVVNVSSINGPCPFPNVTYYCMSKAALDQFTKCLALEMAPKSVRVNSVNPGVTKSKFHLNSGMNPEQYAQFLERSATTHALGRYAEPEEVAEAVLFLATERSSFTNIETTYYLLRTIMRVAVITGASSGIGKAAAIRLVQEGFAVSITGRNAEELQKTADGCVAKGLDKDKILLSVGDITNADFAKKLIDDTIAKFGSVYTLINSAGILTTGSVLDTELDVYDKVMSVNVRSIIQLTRLALPHIIKEKGTIVNVSSINGPCPFPNVTYYCMSKSALDQFTKCLALEMAPKGVRVNSVNPGVIQTECHKNAGMNPDQYAQFLEKSTTTHPLGRYGQPEEVAEAILFLSTERSSFTTGHLLRIDGGRGWAMRIHSIYGYDTSGSCTHVRRQNAATSSQQPVGHFPAYFSKSSCFFSMFHVLLFSPD
ncbi:hypothetical protein WR25_26651 [Diploscapter pachys]|uniref:Uncharacterized protein n=1 Tax=Diploscapter pachys TaxID=2018661 RepID=A0A2A2KHS6_9BILA|nr:hypothetical protein WR25_26651 [Diploscapter pachys]